jgi:hypothetical protein
MPINPDAVGSKGEPGRRKWTSKDSLLYAVSVGRGHRPGRLRARVHHREHPGVQQRALPTMAVVLGAGGFGAMGEIGSFNPAMLVHGEQAIDAAGRAPRRGRARRRRARSPASTTRARAPSSSPSRTPPTGRHRRAAVQHPIVGVHPGEGGFGGDRGPSGPATCRPSGSPTTRSPTDPGRPGPALPAERRPQPTALRPVLLRHRAASRSRSCTGSAPTGSPGGRCCTRCATATRPASSTWRDASPRRCSRVMTSPCACGAPATARRSSPTRWETRWSSPPASAASSSQPPGGREGRGRLPPARGQALARALWSICMTRADTTPGVPWTTDRG